MHTNDRGVQPQTNCALIPVRYSWSGWSWRLKQGRQYERARIAHTSGLHTLHTRSVVRSQGMTAAALNSRILRSNSPYQPLHHCPTSLPPAPLSHLSHDTSGLSWGEGALVSAPQALAGELNEYHVLTSAIAYWPGQSTVHARIPVQQPLTRCLHRCAPRALCRHGVPISQIDGIAGARACIRVVQRDPNPHPCPPRSPSAPRLSQSSFRHEARCLDR